MSVSIELPETVLLSSGLSREEFVEEARRLLVLQLFQRSRISAGKAAELLGTSRPAFLLEAGHAGVDVVDLDEDELARELGRV
ncbi:MAG: UPF0175 family protein [Acidobacteriota bacterium]